MYRLISEIRRFILSLLTHAQNMTILCLQAIEVNIQFLAQSFLLRTAWTVVGLLVTSLTATDTLRG